MINPSIIVPKTTIIPNEQIPKDANFQGLRVVRCQTDAAAAINFANQAYEFQHDLGKQRFIRATITRKGMIGLQNKKDRIVAYTHLSLKQFVDLVRYDPSNPPSTEDYFELEMHEAHQQTQSDFVGQKRKNKDDFKTYLLEGVKGYRPLYLPPVAGWQSYKVFEQAIFVAFDESDPNALYGYLYLPSSPIMQSDGQTQTAALFALANSKEATAYPFLNNLLVTLEIELNVDRMKAGQSFADRNGRGSKKNKNLVIALDQSSALSELRLRTVQGTVFEKRIADGRTTGATKTSTTPIADLSTVEQMLLAVVFGNYREKAERLKHHHIYAFEPFAKELFNLLDELFASQWLEKTPQDSDPFRLLYIHGWAFAQKAIAEAYYECRKDRIKPIIEAISRRDGFKTEEETFKDAIASIKDENRPAPAISFEELKNRLSTIDWMRHRKHWIAITGNSLKDGKKAVIKLKSEPNPVVAALAPNTPAHIFAVKNKILSNSWRELTAKENESITD